MSTGRAPTRIGARWARWNRTAGARRAVLAALAAGAIASCERPPANQPSADPLPPNSFAFAVFGDGPYSPSEREPWRRVLAEVRQADVAWLIHVGDLLWYPCSDAVYAERRAELAAAGPPVVYTPGDNEWTDCYRKRQGRYDPLERLASLRAVFFPDPGRSLGARPLTLESQASDPAFAEFRENARWMRGGFVFATLHVVGSGNGREPFATRTAANDAEVERRTAAAVAWLDRTFELAKEQSAKGVVLAMHGDMGLEGRRTSRPGYDLFVAALQQNVASFPGAVLLIHGDSHVQRVDQPLRDATGRAYQNFTRLETFGSPDIGWVRVVVDTVAGRIARFEPRLTRGP